MASIINADTSDGLKITSDTSGEINLQSGGATIATVDSSGITAASGKVFSGDGSSLTNLPAISNEHIWQDVTGSRSAGVTYTNTTDNPIFVSITCNNSSSAIITHFYIDGVSVVYTNATYGIPRVSIIVPKDSTYQLTLSSGAPLRWFELR